MVSPSLQKDSRRTAMQNQDFLQEVNRLLLANYVPACVVIDSTMEILQVRGHTSFYLELAPGKTGATFFFTIPRNAPSHDHT
jgi:two-component system CheB/CheR fusion protein